MIRRHQQHDAHVRAWQRSGYASHVAAWRRFIAERRYRRAWYRGTVSRTTQLKQLRGRGDGASYSWLKSHWRTHIKVGVCANYR